MDFEQQRVVYLNADGSVGVLVPVDCGLTIEQIAAKDVPSGRPYKIVDASEIPSDLSSRERWTVDEADLDDGVGADYGIGAARQVIGWRPDGSPILTEGAAS
jgi:hypothetical protein